ncbi:MAG TPA: cation:proton antiporter [Xanthobacteraceae bacterium]|jgi:Kef-type K+ transport system membrane component KefB/nucleotide-binding universal stress UspA family protein|nr:cation:proton antiporter [Xanthobacteraceae bacterium]
MTWSTVLLTPARTCLRAGGCAVGALVLSAGAAFAAEGAKAGASDVIFLAQLIALMLVGRLLGEVMNRIGQPSVMGMLLGGIVLGPTVLGVIWPALQHAIFPSAPEQKAMLDGIAQFGILLLLLLTGMETDLKLVRTVGKAALSISVAGVAVPFICGFALGQLMPQSLLPHPDQRLLTSLFLGTALSISSIKIVAAVVREMGFTRRNLGQIIVASAICEDSIGWVIIAITFGLAQAGTIDVMSVAKTVLGTAVFLIASFTFGRRIVYFLIRWTNDNFESDFPVITVILVIMGIMALITHFIGVHTVLGAFVAGILVGESPILSKHIDEQLRGLILAFFMPVFFGIAGLSADLTVLKDATLLLMTLGLIAIASFGKFAGAFIGGEFGGLTRREAFALACGMNARGSTEVIVATIGLSMGALTQNLFTMIVTMAVATTMAMPPMLRWALRRVPLSKPEKQRLEREEHEARGFVSNLERLLLAVDQSPNGKFAARLAGLLAGTRGIAITVLPLSDKDKTGGKQETKEPRDRIEETVRAAAEDTALAQSGDDEPAPVDVTIRKHDAPSGEAVAKEAEKGYDLLVVGVENTRVKNGGFHQDVSRIASAFEGPLAIVAGNGDQLRHPQQSPLHILVPVTGNEVSRRAADVAIAIARAYERPITALYVATGGASNGRKRLGFRARRQEQAIMRDIVEMADRHDVVARTAVHADVTPHDAILAELKKRGHDLIVMGVSRRPGDKLFFGDTAAAVLEKSPASIVFVAS